MSTTADVRIRPLAVTEGPLLAAFAERLFMETYAATHRAADLAAYVADVFTPARQAAELAEPGVVALLAEDAAGAPAGYALLRVAAPPADLAPAAGGDGTAAEIARFYVDRAHHGRGVARALMAACVAEAARRGARALWLQVWDGNARAIRFYEREGFRHAGLRTFVIGESVDRDHLMTRSLEAPMIPEKVNLAAAFARIGEYWSPRIAGELNGQQVKVAKLLGEFVWHHHDAEDELFLVHRGRLRMEFRDQVVVLEPGEFLVVPRGVEHRPVAEEEVEILLFEPAGTLNTGNVRNERTIAEPARL